MKNFEAVEQWAATLNATKALDEITRLKNKYPWLKCEESFAFISKMANDLPKISNLVRHQEEQNVIHRRFIEVNQTADEAIVRAVAKKVGIEV